MNNALDTLSLVCLYSGAFFFLAGTVGLLRFPDIYTRLHALTKADNAGLGLLVLGLVLQAPSAATAVKLVMIWLLVMASSASVSHLIARAAHRQGLAPWEREP